MFGGSNKENIDPTRRTMYYFSLIWLLSDLIHIRFRCYFVALIQKRPMMAFTSKSRENVDQSPFENVESNLFLFPDLAAA